VRRPSPFVPIAIVVLCAVPSLARADGASFDLGVVRSRVAVTDQTALDATLVRFAIRADVDSYVPYLHIGVEAEEGSLSGTTHLPNGVVARAAPGSETSPTSSTIESPLEGNVLAIKTFAGVHANASRRLRLGADFALGMRDAWVESDAGNDVAGRKYEPVFEARSRIDVRLTEKWLIGAMASSDLIERRDVSLAFLLTLDCAR
jgi:hypothetical protein